MVKPIIQGGLEHNQDGAPSEGHIMVIEDEAAVRQTLHIILTHAGYKVTGFTTATCFLEKTKNITPNCLLVDLNLPDMTGIELLARLESLDYQAPILMISGKADISLAVKAIQTGAIDFIEKPFRSAELLSRIARAIEVFSAQKKVQHDIVTGAQLSGEDPFHVQGYPPLTRRETEALALFVIGDSNKEAARKLSLSPRTVEEHRANIMKKFGAKSSPDLIRIVLTQGQAAQQDEDILRYPSI